jgi:hypothetical protein
LLPNPPPNPTNDPPRFMILAGVTGTSGSEIGEFAPLLPNAEAGAAGGGIDNERSTGEGESPTGPYPVPL